MSCSYSTAKENHKAPIKNWLFCSSESKAVKSVTWGPATVRSKHTGRLLHQRQYHSLRCEVVTLQQSDWGWRVIRKPQRKGDAQLSEKQNWGATILLIPLRKIPFKTIPWGRAGEKRLHFISNTLRNEAWGELSPVSYTSKISYSTEELNYILFFKNANCSLNLYVSQTATSSLALLLDASHSFCE